MIEFWSLNWGDVASSAGLFVSLVGLLWVFLEARSARSASEKAESAAQAAESAASETRGQIARHLQTVNVQRAIGLIRLVKTLHDNDDWTAARQHYPALREMLTGIIGRGPENLAEFHGKLLTARDDVNDMYEFVEEHSGQEIDKSSRSRLNRILNNIETDLEQLANATSFGESKGETK